MTTGQTRALLALLAAGNTTACSLILDFSELPDAGATDAADSCLAFEDNDAPDSPAELDGSASAAICLGDPADLDFFRFTAPGDRDTTLRLAMMDGTGPRSLGLRLYADGDPAVLAELDTAADEEVLERSAAAGTQLAAGDYLVEVFGTNPENTNEYTLSVVFSAALTSR